MDIALGNWQFFDWMHSPGLSSSTDALNMLRHVQVITIGGETNSNLNPNNEQGTTYFLIDKLGWQPSSALPAYDPSVDSLRKYAEANDC
jgi:hypothetical protein